MESSQTAIQIGSASIDKFGLDSFGIHIHTMLVVQVSSSKYDLLLLRRLLVHEARLSFADLHVFSHFKLLALL